MVSYSNDRDLRTSIGYIAVPNEHINGGIHTNQTSVEFSSPSDERSISPNSNSTDTCVQKIGQNSSVQDSDEPERREVSGWPTAPRKLSNFSIPLFVGDLFLILLPIAFLALGISAWRLDKKELSNIGLTVERAMNLGPTIYPLAFAAIGSRCLRNIAVHLAERGTTIATLEKLLGSQSLVSAIGTAFTLRSYSLLSFGVLLIWTLSPLGGQSSLRLLHQANSTVQEHGNVYYADHDVPINPDEAGSWLNIVPAVLSAGLASSPETKDLPVDLWNHPRIPRLDAVEHFSRDQPTEYGDWIDLNTTEVQKYSSWAGVNVQNLHRTGSTEFQIRYNYIHVDCGLLFSGSAEDVWQDMLAANLTMYPPVPITLDGIRHDVSRALQRINTDDGALSMFLQFAYPSNDTNKFRNDTSHAGFDTMRQPVSLLYGASFKVRGEEYKYSDFYQVYDCAPRTVTLDAQIHCQAGNCVATRLRHIPGPSIYMLGTRCDQIYKIGCLTFGTHALYGLIHFLPRALTSSLGLLPNPFDDWIAGNNLTYRGYRSGLSEDLRFTDLITDQLISERLTTLINTFWQATAWGRQVTRAGQFDPPPPRELYEGLEDVSPERWMNTTDAVFATLIPVYTANVGWIVTLLLITTVLLLLGIINVVVSFLTIAPDLFYYASSLARENPYIDTPDGGTALDGGARSRLLRAMKVQIADVSPENQVGYVVLKSVGDNDNFQIGRLKKDRLYW